MVTKRRNTGESLNEVKERVFSVRRTQLRKLIDLEYDGSIRKLVAVLGTEEKRSRASFISQILSGNRQLGERAARSIEVEAEKPANWLDGNDPSGATAKKEAASSRRIERLRAILAKEHDGDVSAFAARTGISDKRASYLQGLIEGTRYLSASYAAVLEDVCSLPKGSLTEV